VASANNKTIDESYPYHIGTWYSLPDRYRRITEMLESKPKLSIDDFKEIQLDQHSKLAEDYLPVFLKALENFKTMDKTQVRAYEILKSWDYDMNAKLTAPAVFETMYLKVIGSIFEDELGTVLFENFNGATSISRRAVYQILMKDTSSVWIDNVNTADIDESLGEDIITAFRNAVAQLSAEMGNDPDKWTWGKIHTFEPAHPLGTVKILDLIFNLNRGPFETGGSFHTVSPYSYGSNEPFSVNHGSSHRHIYDLQNWDNSLTVIPTGNSGIPASIHYCDQTSLYLNGEYHKDNFSRDAVVATHKYYMWFMP